ncbi:fimbrial biogenesis chaperone [Thiosulfativibrio zosterae]|uniref:Pili assembly chaperone N-terminal domain-containing protein n=1 Tax=Thiosulfativibrio zosterae TaxID=2675053 RepID=A0A6F8PLW8_9GAMM|nr:molecular chaperone [Thiosulfativibrio zosterae]BBP42990.1 hypothetical protein THMIRHAT_07360 [Thiosulfativibrio zosterae]
MKNLIFLVLMICSTLAHANLLISPTRILFSGNERAENVVIMNQGNTTATYRIELVTQRQTADGGYLRLDNKKDDLTGMFAAEDMIRFSPRQVTLAPGEKQTVRLSLRRPERLPEGEYRTHLGFTQLPNPVAIDSAPGAAKMQVFMLTSFTIPVQVWQGKLNLQAKIAKAQILATPVSENPKQKQWAVAIDLNRSGSFSSVGKLNVYWKPTLQEEYQRVAFLDNSTLYRELSHRTILIGLKDQPAKKGYYKVDYEAAKFYPQRIFDVFEFQY